jgi:Leucine-rich repeat (LRR) protein
LCVSRFPTSGSLIRSEKIDKFESLENAIQERYLAPEGFYEVDDELLMEARDALQASFLKVVGMDKIREKQGNLKAIEDITICHSTINKAGKLPDLESLKLLCLQSSCIADWNVVDDIVKQIPSLRSLDLSFNRLLQPEIGATMEFENLHSLILNHCGMSEWDDVLNVVKMSPNLKELSVKQNGIKELKDSSDVMKNLERLILGDNSIEDFNEILKLGNLTALSELLINNNQIKHVKLPKCTHDERLSIFPSLEAINLRHNPIEDDIQMFNELDKLPALTKFSYTSHKLAEGDEAAYLDTFLQAVGMIRNLKSFNRSEIEKTQRSDAMYEIWKKFATEYLKSLNGEDGLNLDDFYLTHRSYANLVQKFGSPDQFIIQQNRKRVTTIEVQFKNITDGKMYRKKVPLAMTTHTLYGLIYKIAALHTAGMDLKSFKLYYIDAYNNNIKVYLDNLSKSLDFYSLSNGDVIYIEK